MAKNTTKKVTKKSTKKSVRSVTKRSSSQSVDVTRFLVPAVLASVVTWAISGNSNLGGMVFLIVLVVNWFGMTYRPRR